MASSLIVEVCRITNICPHPDADKLDLSLVKGWQVVVGRAQFKEGDLIVYIPIDAVIPTELADKWNVRNYLGGQDNDRVKCARLRGEMSYGLIMPNEGNWAEGEDVAQHYGITKYIAPVRAVAADAVPRDILFPTFTDIENINNFPDSFEDGEGIIVTEKIDGCFSSDQKVMLPNGEYMPISEIRSGDMVLAYDEKKEEFLPSKVEDVLVKCPGKEWIRLDFDNSKEIVCTSDHLFLTKNRDWVEAKDLTEEDELVELGIK